MFFASFLMFSFYMLFKMLLHVFTWFYMLHAFHVRQLLHLEVRLKLHFRHQFLGSLGSLGFLGSPIIVHHRSSSFSVDPRSWLNGASSLWQPNDL